MFETEDMLPRPPPKPSAPPLSNNGAVKPQVPEVSIIFGQPKITATISTAQQPQSYAAWKKQVLPRVVYPPDLRDASNGSAANDMVTGCTKIYPMRAATTVSPENAFSLQQKEILNKVRQVETTLRHSLENAIVSNGTTSNCKPIHEQRRSADAFTQRTAGFPNEHRLTICVSTQTDFDALGKYNADSELSAVMKTLNLLQEEQRQIRHLLETFIMTQKQQQQQESKQKCSNALCCDMATQCEIISDIPIRYELQNPNIHFESETIHQALPNVKIYSPLTRDLARTATPATPLNQYRNNTPTTKFSTPESVSANSCGVALLPKACTEKSVVMNELALKYLPNDKLNELMQDAFINIETAPLREIDNLQKAPVDISTASLLYLRKYRLLPQQQQNVCTPPPQKCINQTSPAYNQQRQEQPIAEHADSRGSPPLLDLERLRGQPKFL